MVSIKNIVIVSEYWFLTDAMCDHIRGSWSGGCSWKTQGFWDNHGLPIPEEPYLKKIDDRICYMEKNGVKVQFWRVHSAGLLILVRWRWMG